MAWARSWARAERVLGSSTRAESSLGAVTESLMLREAADSEAAAATARRELARLTEARLIVGGCEYETKSDTRDSSRADSWAMEFSRESRSEAEMSGLFTSERELEIRTSGLRI